MNTQISTRIKRYEKVSDHKLMPRSPLFIRVDGRAFHTYTRGCVKPFDQNLIQGMIVAAQKTAREMQGFKLAYIQSDECTFMLTDYDTHETMGWFDYELNKVVSITASAYTAYFNQYMGVDKLAMFDARAFTVPEDDAPNVFVWRQQDWERNSVQMLARSLYSQKQLQNKNMDDLIELISEKGTTWEALKPVEKYGTFIFPSQEPLHTSLSYDKIYKLTLEGLGK